MKTGKTLEKKLTAIANLEIPELENRSDLEAHRNDEEDFFETSIWSLKAALLAAYELGRQSTQKNR